LWIVPDALTRNGAFAGADGGALTDTEVGFTSADAVIAVLKLGLMRTLLLAAGSTR
jgi:hypothetical protein